MRRDRDWAGFVFLAVLSAWLVGIAVATIAWGVWAGVAVWLAPPAIVGVISMVVWALSINRTPLEDSIARHPSSHEWADEDSGNVVDITHGRLGDR